MQHPTHETRAHTAPTMQQQQLLPSFISTGRRRRRRRNTSRARVASSSSAVNEPAGIAPVILALFRLTFARDKPSRNLCERIRRRVGPHFEWEKRRDRRRQTNFGQGVFSAAAAASSSSAHFRVVVVGGKSRLPRPPIREQVGRDKRIPCIFALCFVHFSQCSFGDAT